MTDFAVYVSDSVPSGSHLPLFRVPSVDVDAVWSVMSGGRRRWRDSRMTDEECAPVLTCELLRTVSHLLIAPAE